MQEIYRQLKQSPSDINEHLFILREYATMCEHVTEFGVRTGRSTAALLAGNPKKMVSYDVSGKRFNYGLYKQRARPTLFDFIVADVTKIEIVPTDLLFIDTYHSHAQLKKELELHSHKVKRYLIMHDYVIFGEKGEDGKTPGTDQAVNEFLRQRPDWNIRSVHLNNNGLLVLEKNEIFKEQDGDNTIP